MRYSKKRSQVSARAEYGLASKGALRRISFLVRIWRC